MKIKNIITVILALFLCLGLIACGETSDKTEHTESNSSDDADFLYREWLRVSDGVSLSFDKDGNCVLNGTSCKYEYNKSLGVISLYTAVTRNLNVNKDNGVYTLTMQDDTFVPSEHYEKYHTAYMDTYIAENLPPLIDGKTELLVGNTYTTANGLVFTFEKAELITKENKYGFGLHFLCDTEFDISTAKYNSPRNMAGFGMQQQPNDSDALIYVFGAWFDKEKIEEDVNDYGILSFIIDGTGYYVSVDEFFK